MKNTDIKISASNNEAALKHTKSVKEILLGTLKGNMRQYSMVLAMLLIWAFFSISTGGIFITSRNLSNLFLQCASTAIMACGMVLVMVAGHINLGSGSLVGMTGAIAATLMVKQGLGTIATILITIAIGLLCGLFEGFWVAYGRVPAFIVTLGTFLAFRGGVLLITGGNSVAPMNDSFKQIGQGYLPKIFESSSFNDTSILVGIVFIVAYLIFEIRKRRSRVKYGFEILPISLQISKMVLFSIVIAIVVGIMASYMGIPYAILLLVAIIIIFTVIAEKTTFGRHVYAIGGNKEAAKLSGINVNKVNLMIFVIMGLLSTIAGIVYTARLNASIAAAGVNMEMDAIASAVIGGTSTLGGSGTIYGCIIGALVMGSLDNGMSLMNANPALQYIVKGSILILAVWFDIKFSKRT